MFCAAALNRACYLFSSQSQALAHYKGTKHAKKLKALDAPKTKLKASVVTKETANQEIAKGINTSQVPDGTDRKGLCVPAHSPTHVSLLSFLCAAVNVGPSERTFFVVRFDLLHANMQSLQELDGLAVDYINPALGCSGQRAGCPLCAQILNLWSLGDLCRTQADIRGMKWGLSMLQTKCSWDQQGCV